MDRSIQKPLNKPLKTSKEKSMDKFDAVLVIAEHDYALMNADEKLRQVKWSWNLYKRKGVTVSKSLRTLLENKSPQSLTHYDSRFKELVLMRIRERYMAHSNESISKKYSFITGKEVDITCKRDRMHRINSIYSFITSVIVSSVITVLTYIFIQQKEASEPFIVSLITIENAYIQIVKDIWFTTQLFILALIYIPPMVFFWVAFYQMILFKGFHNPYSKSIVLTLMLLVAYAVCYVIGGFDARIAITPYF